MGWGNGRPGSGTSSSLQNILHFPKRIEVIENWNLMFKKGTDLVRVEVTKSE